jgi:DNA-binding NarL/FixJ family response regulator
MRVLAVDDHPGFRAAARRVVEATDGFEWAGEAGSGAEAVELMHGGTADLVVLGPRLPDGDPIESARRLVHAHPGAAVLLLSSGPPATPAGDLLRCGARAHARKQDFSPALLRRLGARQPSGTQP